MTDDQNGGNGATDEQKPVVEPDATPENQDQPATETPATETPAVETPESTVETPAEGEKPAEEVAQ